MLEINRTKRYRANYHIARCFSDKRLSVCNASVHAERTLQSKNLALSGPKIIIEFIAGIPHRTMSVVKRVIVSDDGRLVAVQYYSSLQ